MMIARDKMRQRKIECKQKLSLFALRKKDRLPAFYFLFYTHDISLYISIRCVS